MPIFTLFKSVGPSFEGAFSLRITIRSEAIVNMCAIKNFGFNSIKKETPAQVLSGKFCDIFEKAFQQNISGPLPLHIIERGDFQTFTETFH